MTNFARISQVSSKLTLVLMRTIAAADKRNLEGVERQIEAIKSQVAALEALVK